MTMSGGDIDPAHVTFFNISKKIPKGVKRHCGMCRQHGVVAQTRNHACPFKSCDCTKCNMVRQRRSIMSMQIRLRREQDKMFVRTNEPEQAEIVPPLKPSEQPSACYFCQKCKNHGILMWKKDHKKTCAFVNCKCEQCELIDTRRALDSHIKKGKREKRPHNDDKMEIDSNGDPEMRASSFASSPTVSDQRTPSVSGDIEISSPMIDQPVYTTVPSIDFVTVPEVKTEIPTVPTTVPSPVFFNTEMLIQQLALLQAQQQQQQRATVSLPSPTVSPFYSIPQTQPVQYVFPQQPQTTQPTITFIQNPVYIPMPTVTVPEVSSVPQPTVSDLSFLPQLTNMDIHNIVCNVPGIEQFLLMNARV